MVLTRQRRYAGWLALWALVWHALAPSLAHAVVSPGPGQGGAVEICSSTGVVTVALLAAADDAVPSVPRASDTPHCDWCQLSGGDLAVPPSVLQRTMVWGTVDFPARSTPGWALPTHWRPAAPRGPPAV